MSLQEIENSSKIWLTPADIAPILRCDPQCIRVQAQQDPSKLDVVKCKFAKMRYDS